MAHFKALVGILWVIAASNAFALDVITYKYQSDISYSVDSYESELNTEGENLEESSQSRQLNSFLLPVPLHALMPKGDFQLVYLYEHIDDSLLHKPFSFEHVMQTLFLKLSPESNFNYFLLLQKVTGEQAFSKSDFYSVIYGFNALEWAKFFGLNLFDIVIRHEYLFGKQKDSFYLKLEKSLSDRFTLHLMAISYFFLEYKQQPWSLEAGIKGDDVFLPGGLSSNLGRNYGRGSETMVFMKATRKLKQYFSLSAELGTSSMKFDFYNKEYKTIARVESGFSRYFKLGLQLDL